MFDDNDSPELYDLRFGSGVVRLEEGVTLFLGMNDGDWFVDRGRVGRGSVCVGGVCGRGGAGGAIDIRFKRRASVGLMVRAPKPVACGMVDIRLDDEEGVVFRKLAPAEFLTGVRTAFVDEDLV